MANSKKLGRPAKTGEEKTFARQIGRWTDADWDVIREAAQATTGGNVAAFAKGVLLKAAKRVLRNGQ